MLDSEKKNRIKAISIVDYLASKGYRPEKQHRQEYVYFSPLRNESTPSFFVNPQKNLYKDYGDDGGDILSLVMKMETCNFVTAMNKLNTWDPLIFSDLRPPFSIDYSEAREQTFEISNIYSIRHPALINYLDSRKISFSLADRFLKELHYINKGKKFFALGFANDNGGWAIRNDRFKGCFAASGVSYLKVENSSTISVFEGFFDFLSALAYSNSLSPKNSVLVLNSTSNLKHGLKNLSGYRTINAFLDNDAAGRKVIDDLQKWKFPISDKAHIYEGFKDFGEFWNNTDTSNKDNSLII